MTTSTGFSVRTFLKLSVLAGAAVALPLERSASGASVFADRIASSRLPAPFTTAFEVPPVIYPVRSDEVTGRGSRSAGIRRPEAEGADGRSQVLALQGVAEGVGRVRVSLDGAGGGAPLGKDRQ